MLSALLNQTFLSLSLSLSLCYCTDLPPSLLLEINSEISLNEKNYKKHPKNNNNCCQRTCQIPILSTCLPKGRWWLMHSLKASVRISMTLLSKAQRAASGKAEENRITYPNWINISRKSSYVSSYYQQKHKTQEIVLSVLGTNLVSKSCKFW